MPARYPYPLSKKITTKYSLPTGGTTRAVHSGDNLQTVFDAAVAGDVIVIDENVTFSGNYNINSRAAGGWIYVISSGYSSLPAPGTRVGPANAANMPKISSPTYTNPAMIVKPGVTKWRFVGIEFTSAYNLRTNNQYGIVRVGWDTINSGALIGSPADSIVFDRCYLHGTTTGNNRDGLVCYNITNLEVTDSYLADIQTNGDESHAIHIYNSPGPTKIKNSYISAAGINLFIGDNNIGGAAPPGDIEIINNTFFKPLRWKSGDPSYDGFGFKVKNLLELKAAQRVFINNNSFENCWIDAQNGTGFLLSPRADAVSDITFTNNMMKKCVTFMRINSVDVTLNRVLIKNNILYDFMPSTAGHCFRLAGTPGAFNYINIEHNTLVGNVSHSSFLNFEGSLENELTGFTFKNNLVTQGSYAVSGNGKGIGFASADFYAEDYVIATNAVIGGTASYYTHTPATPTWTDWRMITDIAAVGFTNTAFATKEDFRLLKSSPYYQAGTNKRDLGVDFSSTNSIGPRGARSLSRPRFRT